MVALMTTFKATYIQFPRMREALFYNTSDYKVELDRTVYKCIPH